MGMRGILEMMALTPQQTFDAQWNSFDRGVIGLRCERAIRAWLAGDTTYTHVFPHPHRIRRMYQRTLDRIENAGVCGTIANPFPADFSLTRYATHFDQIKAAQDGREQS